MSNTARSERFKDHQLTFLPATDLVARGIDIEHLECVINYDIPVRLIPTVPSNRRMGRDGYVIKFYHPPRRTQILKIHFCQRTGF